MARKVTMEVLLHQENAAGHKSEIAMAAKAGK